MAGGGSSDDGGLRWQSPVGSEGWLVDGIDVQVGGEVFNHIFCC